MASRFLTPFSTGRSLFAADPLLELHREMNRLFDDMLRGTGVPGSAASGSLIAAPRIDMRESDNELCIVADVPGVDPKDIDLQLDGDTLVVSGEKKNESEQQQSSYHVMERSYGRFQRAVQLPFAPDPGQVQASFEHGVLTVRLPKQAQQPRTHRIEVRSGSSSLEAPSRAAGQSSGASGGAAAGSGAGGDRDEVLAEGMSSASDGTSQGGSQPRQSSNGDDRPSSAG